MAESTRLVDLVQQTIDGYLANRAPQLVGIAEELAPFVDYSRALLSGGKRFRALFCYWGWQAVAANDLSEESSESDFDSVLLAATALEVFHAAALVHDDIMDNSDTRRGMPAVHRRFQQLHEQSHWLGSSTHFGESAALLLGDLLLSWSDEMFAEGLSKLQDLTARIAARAEFNLMRTEVTAGQYLDILEEKAWSRQPESSLLSRAQRVVVYKSAKYSVEAPLAIGASLGGGSLAQLASLREFGLPLGIAFQLRDDVLGVFGDPQVTGKPAGDDLREGKRTMLVAIAREKLPASARRLVDELLGDPEITELQVELIQNTIRESGALDALEVLIEDNSALALAALDDAPLGSAAKRQLTDLVATVTRRSF